MQQAFRPKTGQNGMGIVRYLEGYNASRLFPQSPVFGKQFFKLKVQSPLNSGKSAAFRKTAHTRFLFFRPTSANCNSFS